MDIVGQMLIEKFSKKKSLLDANNTAIRLGFDYAKANYECPLPFHLEKMDATKDYIIIEGNAAAALGAVYAGATVGAWYPITPSTSMMEAFKAFCQQFRTDPETGLGRYCIIQAEDELAAAGIAIGAGWAGARAFTNTSGPGISLMQEFIGLAYYTEIPAVFFDIQRTGPSTGMPTRTQQADLFSLAYASHGDTKHIVLFPCNPEECFYLTVAAFDLADRFQTPVFVASDLDIGMNDWMCKRLEWDDSYRPDRGKCLTAAELESVKKFSRYLDAEGDGIAARSLPGVHGNGAYFVRGSGHDKHGTYTEDSDSYQEVVDRLARKFKLAAKSSGARDSHVPGAEVGIVSLGGLPRRGGRGDRSSARRGNNRRLHAHQGISLRRARSRVSRFTHAEIRRRAEPRRAAALAAGHRDRHAARRDDTGAGLRRHAAHGQVRRPMR